MILNGISINGRIISNTIVEVDPNFADVSLLLHGEGANNSTTIIDSSSHNFGMTAVGGAVVSTAQYRYGAASLKFSTYNDYVWRSTKSTEFTLASSSVFTIEASVYLAAHSPVNSVGNRPAAIAISNFDTTEAPNNAWWWTLRGTSTNTGSGMQYSTWDTSEVQRSILWSFPSNLSLNTWYDVAIVRNGSNWYGFLNGTLLSAPGTNTIGATTQTQATGNIRLGSTPYNSFGNDFRNPLNGYIDEFRLTKGVARYTTSYTPTGPFPNAGP